MNNKVLATHLGRFAPYHLGHEKVTGAMIERHGVENCLVIVGSSNKFDIRTPFTFEQRRKLIQSVFPDIQIIDLPDIEESKLHFQPNTLDQWIKQVFELQSRLSRRLKFYTGSAEDVSYLTPHFETEVLVDRTIPENGSSATEVRQALLEDNNETLLRLVNPKLVDQTRDFFRENIFKII